MFEVPCQCSWPQKEILKVCLLSGVSVRFPKAVSNWKCWYNCNLRQNVGGIGTHASERPLELELSFHHLKVKLALVKVESGYFPFYWNFSESSVSAHCPVSCCGCQRVSIQAPSSAALGTLPEPPWFPSSLLGQRSAPARRAVLFPTNTFWKAKKWLHLIFVSQDYIKGWSIAAFRQIFLFFSSGSRSLGGCNRRSSDKLLALMYWA